MSREGVRGGRGLMPRLAAVSTATGSGFTGPKWPKGARLTPYRLAFGKTTIILI
jgi:hypothetical protein